MTRYLPLFVFFAALSFLAGVFTASFLWIPQIVVGAFFILGIGLIPLCFLKRTLAAFCLILIFFSLGVWRFQQVESTIRKNELVMYADSQELVEVRGRVVAEPEIRNQRLRLTIQPVSVKIKNREFSLSSGKIFVTTDRYPEYQYGDELRIMGNLEIPLSFEDLHYKDYLRTKGIYSVMYWPKIEKISEPRSDSPIDLFNRIIIRAKDRLQESIYRSLPPPQSALLAALLFGDESQLSDLWKEKFNRTGVRHITAVSGMNITIIARIVFAVFLAFGLWRRQAFYLATFFLISYVVMVGAPASAVRAGIMGSLLLLAQQVGRPNNAGRALVFAAATMVAFNPLVLRFDVGFQLSFSAMLGLVYLEPVFQRYFQRIPQSIFQLKTILTATLSASIFTLPLLLYNFGYISLVSIPANIFIVPFTPFLTILGFLLGFGGIIWEGFGWLLSLPAWFLLTYILKVIEFFSNLPFASLSFQNVHWVFIPIAYTILGFITWRENQNQRFRFLM
jgi:competence protein ComEC